MVELKKAEEADKKMLTNLHQLYLHDLSAYIRSLNVNREGVFETDDIDTFYQVDALIPLVIEYEGKTAGFILLNTPPYAKGDYYINDFFILRKYRGLGIGKLTVKVLFETYKGKYSMMELGTNLPAISFWKKVLTENGIKYEEQEVMDGEDACLVQVFDVL